MNQLRDYFKKDRQRTYAITFNIAAQITAILSGMATPSEAGKWMDWSFCIPFNVMLVYYLITNNLQRYTLMAGTCGMIFLMLIAWAEGGIRSTSVYWYVVAPLAVHYLVDEKIGLYCLGASLLMMLGLTGIDLMGWVLDHELNILESPELVWMSLIDFLSVCSLVFGIPWIYNRSIQERYHTIRHKQTELEHKQKELEHTTQLRDRFIASVSHELRTPMNAILGLNQVLMHRVKDRPEAIKVLKYTQQSADHLMTVINDVLDYSQFTSGEITANKERFRLREVIESAYGLFTPRTENLPFTYRCEVNDDVPQWVVGDRHRLMQVLVNLLGNAIKFTTQGQVVLKVSRSGERVIFSVEDTGIGIAQENLEKIFERYTQVDSHPQTRIIGIGLGLTISRRLVALLGGKLEVSSAVGQGSRFWFSLPLIEHPAEGPEHSTHPPTSIPQRTQQARFLVVDDQVVNRKLVKLILKQRCEDCLVAEATHGADALAMLAKQDFDVVIMDMVMPEMDGIEATQRIRASSNPRLRHMPVLGLTANVTQSDLIRFGNAGVDEIMLKPLQVERFIQSIERLMQRVR